MTSRELSDSKEFLYSLPSQPLAEKLAVVDYISKLFVLLLQFALKNFIFNGKFKQPSILRIGLYIQCVRVIIAIIKDIVALSRGEVPDNAIRVLT